MTPAAYPRARALLAVLAFSAGHVPVSRASAEENSLAISPGPVRTIVPDMLGFNGNMLSLPDGWSRPEMIEAFRRSQAGLFRYPAGTLANTWDWDRGWLDPDVPTADLIDWVREHDRSPNNPHRYPVEEAAKLHRGTGATVVFVLNMLSKDLEHSLRGLRRARDLGMPVKYVEMGNELFFNLPLESRIFPTPEDYGRVSAEWIAAIKREFPGVQCAIVAGGRAGNPRSDRWTERALAHCPNADAIVVHTYTSSGLVGRERRNVTAGTEGTTTGGPALPPAERQQREMELLRTPEGFARMMVTAHTASQRPRSYPRRPGLAVWFTEWNLRGDADAVRGTWANTLFIVTFYHGILQQPEVVLSHFHNVIGPNFAAIHTGENELRHVIGLERHTAPYSLTAGGLATALVGRVATGRTAAQALTVNDAPPLVAGEQSIPALWGWAFSGGDRGPSAFLVNLTAETRFVQPPAGFPEDTRTLTYSAPVDAYVSADDSIPGREGRLGRRLTLPPHSVVQLLP